MISIGNQLLLAFFLGIFGASGPEAASDEEMKLEAVLPSSEYERFVGESRYRNRIRILRQAMEHKLQQLDIFLQHAEPAHMLRLLSELRTLSDAALEESEREQNERELRHREVRRLEIMLRKTIDNLERLQLAFAFDEREPFERTLETMTALRTQLLSQIFGDAISEGDPDASLPVRISRAASVAPSETDAPAALPLRGSRNSMGGEPRVRSQQSESDYPMGLMTRKRGTAELRNLNQYENSRQTYGFSPAGAVRAQGLEGLDRFTLEEFEKVQDARNITKRVEVLLEIAACRLEEIERRRQEQEWTGKDPNPLEYFTYPDLLRAYYRALNSAMVNIDEQATRNMATQRDIRKSLEELNRKVQLFLPQLKSLEEFVREREIAELERNYREALKATETAFQGSAYGLGAPVEP